MTRVAQAAVAACFALAASGRAAAVESETDETARLISWMQQKTIERGQRVFANNGWADYSDDLAAAEAAISVDELAELRASFDPAALDEEGRFQLRLYEFRAEQGMADYALRERTQIFTSLSGPHQSLPIRVGAGIAAPPGSRPGRAEGEGLIARIASADDYLDGARAEFEQRAAAGVLPPRRMFALMIEQAERAISGAPFEAGPPSAMLADVSRTIAGLDASEAEKTELLNEANAALVDDIEPAYRRLIAAFERWEPAAPDGFGMWAPSDADDAYNHLIANNTTLDLTAEQVRDIGLAEIERIEGEVRAVMPEVGFEGTVAELYDFLRTDDRFYFPNTDEGRAAYLAEARRVLDEMQARLGEVVPDPPDAELDVIRYPAALESGAIAGMYMRAGGRFAGSPEPAARGSYVVNLADMRAVPKYLLQPLAYHEGLPGHHLQVTIDAEREATPNLFVVPALFTAYQEGWGLYAEQLPYELGLYTDPYSNIGRLGMEAWRAARLVVDTGIHAEGWAREQAVAFMLAHTPLTEVQVGIEVDRYADNPGQATAYLIGKLKILELRARAQTALGDDFDLRAFHALLLGDGQLPLPMLDELVDAWIAGQAG